jgi:hypothetical protein
MLAALPLAADVAASLALSDRSETRLRNPGDVSTGSSLDIETAPEAQLVLALPRTGCTLAYRPRLTFWDINDVGVRPSWLQAGLARIDWREGNTASLSIEQDASYGATSFASLVFPPGREGTPPRVDVIPSSQIIQYESASTALGSRVEGRRINFRSTVGYQFSGGADEASRLIIPRQTGPMAEGVMTFAMSPVDPLATTVTGSQTEFSSGPEILLVEGDEGWKHRWSALTETELTLGVSEARVVPSPSAQSLTKTNPVAEALVEDRLGTAEDRVTVRIGARLGPVVNRLLGIVDERIQGTVLSKWTRGPFAVNAFASAQQSVPTTGPDATELLTGELGLSYAAADAVVFDIGVRGLWQRASQPVVSTTASGTDQPAPDLAQATIVQGIVFVGVTLRAPTMRL